MPERGLWHALRDACDGLAQTAREQRNFRIHLFAGAVAIALAGVLHFNSTRWAILGVTIGVVLAAELLNTALEHAVDCASPGEQAAARAAKHAGAAAVLGVSVAALFVGAWLYGGAWLER